MMSLIDFVRNHWQGRIEPTASVLLPEEADDAETFVVDERYLGLELTGLGLAFDRVAFSTYAPFAAFLLELGEGVEAPVSIPILLNPAEKLAAIAGAEGLRRPDVRNLSLLGPSPLRHAKLHLFGGLFREERSDTGAILLNTLSALARTTPAMTNVGAALDATAIAYDGIQELLGLPRLEGRATISRGFRVQVRTNASRDDEPLRPGHLLITGGTDFRPDEVYVENGVPVGRDRATRDRLAECDWLILRIIASTRRGSYEDLPSHALWTEVAGLIWNGREEEAEKRAFVDLCRSIAFSPHLIEAEKEDLIGYYETRRASEQARYRRVNGHGAGDGFRGGKRRAGRRPGGSVEDPVQSTKNAIIERAARLSRTNFHGMARSDQDAARAAMIDLAGVVDACTLASDSEASSAEPDVTPPPIAALDAVRAATKAALGSERLLAAVTAMSLGRS